MQPNKRSHHQIYPNTPVMNNILMIVGAILLLASCTKEESISQPPEPNNPANGNIASQWLLEAQLSDPGDGSGVYHPVSSAKRLTFYTDGTVSTNGPLCSMFSEVGGTSTGTYNANDGLIQPSDCGNLALELSYSINGGLLELIYPCIEPCKQRYRQLSN